MDWRNDKQLEGFARIEYHWHIRKIGPGNQLTCLSTYILELRFHFYCFSRLPFFPGPFFCCFENMRCHVCNDNQANQKPNKKKNEIKRTYWKRLKE